MIALYPVINGLKVGRQYDYRVYSGELQTRITSYNVCYTKLLRLGFPSGVSGEELSARALRQARRLGAEILVTRAITRIGADTFQTYLDGGDVLRSRTIILACGVSWRHLAIEGFDRFAGKSYNFV